MKARWCYLYRAIDSTGATIDFLLSALRDAATAKRLFRRALSDPSHPQPRVINTGLKIDAKRVNKPLRIHVFLSSVIRSARAFKPRCTATLTADSDIPHRVVASLMLNPSTFTY